MDETPRPVTDERDNLTRLLNLGRRKRPRINRRYSFFVRGMRFVLPLTALAIVSVVLAWPKMESNVAPVPKDTIIPQSGGRNELISPHFESVTNDQKPYVVTAARAVQSQKDEALILLEKPVADVMLRDDEKINAKADNGVYRQDTGILVLDGNAYLQHSSGHNLTSARMNISMKDQLAWSDVPVAGEGPSGTITGQSMNANNTTGVLIFTGPAKLVLTRTGNSLKPSLNPSRKQP